MLKNFGVTTLSALLLMTTTGAVQEPSQDKTEQAEEVPDSTDTTDRQLDGDVSYDRDEDKRASIITSIKPVEYETRIIEHDSLPKGAKVTIRDGVEGEQTTYRSYTEHIQADGTKKLVPVKHSTMTIAPVNKIILKGTNDTEVSAMSEKAIEREAERQAERAAERQAELEAEQEAEREAERERAAERAANSGDANSSSNSVSDRAMGSSDVSTDVDTSTSAAAMKAQVAPGQVTTPAQNRAYAKAILSPADFEAADKLVRRESEWITTAANPNSSAYGVPQSLPGNKMASAGSDWRTNGMTQFDWMISYVEGRYGSFQNALQHSYTHGWY